MCRIHAGECLLIAHIHPEIGAWPVRNFFADLRDVFLARALEVLSEITLTSVPVSILNFTGKPLMEMITTHGLFGGNEHVILVGCNQPNGLGWSAHNMVVAFLPTLVANGFTYCALQASVAGWFLASRASLLSRDLLVPQLNRKVSVLLLGSLSFVL